MQHGKIISGRLFAALGSLLLPLPLFMASCDGGAEEAGEDVDEAVEDTKEAAEDAAEKVDDAVDDEK